MITQKTTDKILNAVWSDKSYKVICLRRANDEVELSRLKNCLYYNDGGKFDIKFFEIVCSEGYLRGGLDVNVETNREKGSVQITWTTSDQSDFETNGYAIINSQNEVLLIRILDEANIFFKSNRTITIGWGIDA